MKIHQEVNIYIFEIHDINDLDHNFNVIFNLSLDIQRDTQYPKSYQSIMSIKHTELNYMNILRESTK